MGAFVTDPPATRWRPFADALWQVVPDWRERCAAKLEMHEEALDRVYAPCALGALLEDAVPLGGHGWADPLMAEFLRFVELASEMYKLLPDTGERTEDDDHSEMECFLGATVSNALAHSPGEIQALLPYLGPNTTKTFLFSITLPSVEGLWRNFDGATLTFSNRFEPLPIDAVSLLPTTVT